LVFDVHEEMDAVLLAHAALELADGGLLLEVELIADLAGGVRIGLGWGCV